MNLFVEWTHANHIAATNFTDLKDLMNENGLILDDETMDAETEKKKVEEMLMRYQLPSKIVEIHPYIDVFKRDKKIMFCSSSWLCPYL